MPDHRPAHSWVFSHVLVAATFVLVWLQSDHSPIQDSLIPSGRTPGDLSKATVHTVFTARSSEIDSKVILMGHEIVILL